MENSPETSVMFSLAELTRIEDERVREEETQRARVRDERARRQLEELERRREEEAARVATEARARAQRDREESERLALLEARKQAELDAVRIAAEAKVRLEADDAARAHELAVLRLQGERRGGRLQHGLLAGIAFLLLTGAAGGHHLVTKVGRVEREAAALREEQRATAREQERALATELAALDRRYLKLKDRAADSKVADAARSAIAAACNAETLRAFADALDALEARLSFAQRIEELDRRHADLAAWAAQQGKTSLTAPARAAAKRARADERGLADYRKALDDLSAALGVPRRRVPKPGEPTPPECTNPQDPLCGPDGKILR